MNAELSRTRGVQQLAQDQHRPPISREGPNQRQEQPPVCVIGEHKVSAEDSLQWINHPKQQLAAPHQLHPTTPRSLREQPPLKLLADKRDTSAELKCQHHSTCAHEAAVAARRNKQPCRMGGQPDAAPHLTPAVASHRPAPELTAPKREDTARRTDSLSQAGPFFDKLFLPKTNFPDFRKILPPIFTTKNCLKNTTRATLRRIIRA
jgi:hypothetical protein